MPILSAGRGAIAAALLGFAAPPSLAQMTEDPALDIGALKVDLDLERWAEVEAAVKDSAVFPVIVRSATTLEQLVEANCPGASSEYIAALPEAAATLNPSIYGSKDTSATIEPTKGGSIVFLPYCLGQSSPRYIVQNGDSPWQVWKQAQPDGELSDFAAFQAELERLNGETGLADFWLPGEQIALPTTQLTIALPSQGIDETLTRVNGIEDVTAVVEQPNWGTLNQLDETLTSADCGPEGELEAMQRAQSQLWSLASTMMLNDEIDNKATNWSRDAEPVWAAVLDTAILGADLPVMKQIIAPLFNPSENIWDETYLAQEGDPVAPHGTAVLVSAAGGQFFAALNSLIEAVRIVPVNIYSRLCLPGPDGTIICSAPFVDDKTLAPNLMQFPHQQGEVTAINLSTNFPSAVPNLENFVSPEADFLIVVSAGNKGAPLVENAAFFPAVLGGKEAVNVVTVGAIDLDNEPMAGSNKSSRLVDIAAWGCSVPSLSYDAASGTMQSRFVSGTSFAAPQVLFAASTIRREPHAPGRRLRPLDIKARLIASADLVPALQARGVLVANAHGGLEFGPGARAILKGETELRLIVPPKRERRRRGGSGARRRARAAHPCGPRSRP